ncbi:MAG: glycosyl transferase family 2 [Halorhabdus sp.]
MEYVQERITTLHDFGGAAPSAPTDRAVVVVPMTERDHASLAAERVLSTLETVDPRQVIVALRADPDRVPEVATWLDSFDLSLDVLWCNAPAVESALAEAALDGHRGKGRDVWLALGIAAERGEYVVVHDADAENYAATHVPRLLFPLSQGDTFAKAYYARVENDQLYGRLFRLLYVPLVRTLADAHDAAILEYFGAFRYALAGEFAATGEVARQLTPPRGWGLEVGTLGDAYEVAGFADTAQIDLGMHEHDHRAVGGPEGLGNMARDVATALFRVLEGNGVTPDYDSLPDRYRETARTYVEQYAADAAFNGLAYDRSDERDQIEAYAGAISPPGEDDRLPAWDSTTLDPERIATLAGEALADRRE